MKKILSFMVAVIMVFSLTACGSESKSQKKSDEKGDSDAVQVDKSLPQKKSDEKESNAAVQVDKGLLNVDVTLPGMLFENMTEEEIAANAEELGCDDFKINADGSVTYTMSKKIYNEMLSDMETIINEEIEKLLDGEDKVESFVDIKCNDNFSKIDIYVDAEKYTSRDAFYVLPFYTSGAVYQSFYGVAIDDIDVAVSFIDSETDEELSVSSYKEWIANINADDETDDFDE